MRYFRLMLCIVVAVLVSGAYAGCGVDTNPYDDDPGPQPNGYFPPSPDFFCNPLEGYAPLVVSFTDKSTNIPTNWAWNFGDGYSSNIKNPVHIFQSPGTYSVSLTAGNGYGGNSITKTNYIVVNAVSAVPVMDFTANITSGYLPLQVKFSDLSTGGTIISRTWEFDHNSLIVTENSPGQTLLHTFTETGKYSVTLTVTTENNESASLEKKYYISVMEPIPEQVTITLQPGWNLISTPLPLNDQYHTAGQIFGTIDTGSRSIFSYNAVTKQFIPLNYQSEIVPLEPIWVYSKNEAPMAFRYNVTQPVSISMHLPSGWNLIGYPSIKPGTAREGFSSIGTLWSTILCFDSVTQQYSTTIFNEGEEGQSDDYLMNPINGYWIYMPKEGDLIITLN
jgi:PKD repeat protein